VFSEPSPNRLPKAFYAISADAEEVAQGVVNGGDVSTQPIVVARPNNNVAVKVDVEESLKDARSLGAAERWLAGISML
jgi:hypothetical protein